ncbi:hypothetical protein [uncultured Clostridium sp.]|uniref:hypothetical protein n=1 Tax=uncultured Clostridium sp. TaxID=59620 RepID=UPI00261FE6C9|nr:hypothetical protein [uncultured Clostridium sp.]
MNWFNIVAIVLTVVIASIGIYDYRQDRRGIKLDIFENKEEILEYLKYKRHYSYVIGATTIIVLGLTFSNMVGIINMNQYIQGTIWMLLIMVFILFNVEKKYGNERMKRIVKEISYRSKIFKWLI